MCYFVEKLFNFFKKKYALADQRSSKEPFCDALRKQLNFLSPFFQRYFFYVFDASSIFNYMCSIYFHVVHTVFVEKAEISCHRTYLEILYLRLSRSVMPLNMFF